MTPMEQPPHDERKTGLFLGGEMEISPPPDLPPLAKPTARQQTRAPSPARQLPVARGSSTRPTIRQEAPERGGLDDTTKIVAFIALGLVVLGVVALLMMSSRATPAPNVVERAPDKPTTAPPLPPPVVEPLRPLPQGTVTRPAPPPTTTSGQSKNLIANPGFEQATGNQATGWFTHNYNGAPEFTIAAGAGRRGGNAARVFSATGADSKWFQKIQVKPNTTYLMKAWTRCENITGPGRGVQINMEPNDFRSDEIKGTTGWTLLQFTFESRDKTEVDVNCLYGGWGQSTGTAWFDDVEVIELFSGK